MSTRAQHRRTVTADVGAGCFAYCSCGWSSGPAPQQVVVTDHRMHVEQRCGAPDLDTDLEPVVDDGSSTVTLEQYRDMEDVQR